MPYASPLPALTIIASLIWSGLVWWWFKVGRHEESGSKKQQHFITLCTVLAGLSIVVGSNPQLKVSDDVYRYQWDGWLLSNGVDPYSVVPSDPRVAHLVTLSGDRVLPAELPYNTMKTIYPPGAQLLFASISVFVGTDLFWWNMIWLLLIAVMLGVIIRSLEHDVHHRTLALLVVASPLMTLHGFADIHLDILVAGVMAAAFIAVRHNLFFVAGLLLGEGIALKYVPLIALAYLLWSHTPRERWQLLGGAAVVVVLTSLPFLGSDLIGNFPVFAAHWKANAGAYVLVRELVDSEFARMVCAAIGIAFAAIVWLRFRQHTAFATGLTMVGLLLMSPVTHVWYLLPALLLTPFAPLRSVIVWTVTSSVYIVFAAGYAANGEWVEEPVWLFVEFAPVWVAFGVDMWKGPMKADHR